jgi:hypothetical protein
MRTASAQFRAPSLEIALEILLRTVPSDRFSVSAICSTLAPLVVARRTSRSRPLLLATAISLLGGALPSRRAVALQPLDALRYE